MHHVLAGLLLTFTTLTHAASFDCGRAKTYVERTICADKDLSLLDETLDDAFVELVYKDAPSGLRTSQKSWLALRDACPDAACIKRRYEQRIAELSCDAQSPMAGSAIGSSQCSHFSLRLLERDLASIEERHAKKVTESSNNIDYTARTLLTERKAWREYRTAQCALYGAIEGGSDGWKNALAGACEVEETKKRIAHLKNQIATP